MSYAILILFALAVYATYLTCAYGLPYLSLRWALHSNDVKVEILELAEGERRVVGFDYFDDHSDHQSEHQIFRRNGAFYAEQWTAPYGRAASNNQGFYIDGRKLRQGEVRRIPDGAYLYQLDPYARDAKVTQFFALDLAKLGLIKRSAEAA